MSNFAFFTTEFPAVREAAVKEKRQTVASPTAVAFFVGKCVSRSQ